MRETITLDEFRARLQTQGVSDRIHSAFKCPLCKTVQSMQSFLSVGCDAEAAERRIGFSCLGRETGAGAPRKDPDGKPCNWTLGGLLHLHNLEVIGPEGDVHPFFEIASPEEAQALEAEFAATSEGGE